MRVNVEMCVNVGVNVEMRVNVDVNVWNWMLVKNNDNGENEKVLQAV